MGLHPEKLNFEELSELSGLNTHLLEELAKWANKNMSCAQCNKCELRCEVLNTPALNIGEIEADYQRIVSYDGQQRIDATLALVQEKPEMYNALRSCCFCGFCTSECQRHMAAPDRMREWRGLFMEANLMPPVESKMVFVDEQWHIFSAYRAVYGIEYSEFASLDWAATQPGSFDTLFFPGCSLVSYAPELTKTIMRFLQSCNIKVALSDACCGSPLMSAGLFERGNALRQAILDKIRASGITRMITVCPGCGEEFAETFGDEIEIVPLGEVLLEHQDELLAYRTTLEPEVSGTVNTYSCFDSCHDRTSGRHGKAIRSLMQLCVPQSSLNELAHHGKDTLCCGAGGAVAGYNPTITDKRIQRVFREARQSGCDTLITMCPTCTYTIADKVYNGTKLNFVSRHYTEIIFEEQIDWNDVFSKLNGMWTGQYGPWLMQTFF